MNDLAKNLLLWIVIAIVLVSVFNNFTPPRTAAKTIEYSEFVRSVKDGVVSEVLIEGRSIHGIFHLRASEASRRSLRIAGG